MVSTRISPEFLQGGMDGDTPGFYYFPEWKSVNGRVYSRVLKHVLPETMYGLFDTIYLADRKGMVQLVSETQGEIWYLVPPEEDEPGANDVFPAKGDL